MSARAVEAEVSITFAKSTDARQPVQPRIEVEVEGERISIDLTPDDFARLLTGSVMSLVAVVDPA